jgi:hypothetical protein
MLMLLVVVFVVTAGPMLYAVSNFGTLCRLRQMLSIVAILLAFAAHDEAEAAPSVAAMPTAG